MGNRCERRKVKESRNKEALVHIGVGFKNSNHAAAGSYGGQRKIEVF